MDLNKKIYFEWSTNIIIITIIAGIVIIGLYYYMLRNFSFHLPWEIFLPKIGILCLLTFATIVIIKSTPLYIKYNEKGITLKTIICSKFFSQDDIIDIQNITPETIAHSTRKVGSSGVGGFTGLFYNKQLGNYYQYVTKYNNLVLLTIKGKKYVFNCSDRKGLIAYSNNNYRNLMAK